MGDSVDDAGSEGADLGPDIAALQAHVLAVVDRAVSGGRLPWDANALYAVFIADDVYAPGLCTRYCGWHSYAAPYAPSGGGAAGAIKFALVGSVMACPDACALDALRQGPGGAWLTPNGDADADAMAQVLVHEIAEAVTDPQLDAWRVWLCFWGASGACPGPPPPLRRPPHPRTAFAGPLTTEPRRLRHLPSPFRDWAPGMTTRARRTPTSAHG